VSAVQELPNGKLAIFGSSDQSGTTETFVGRLLANGTWDPTFGAGAGWVEPNLIAGNETPDGGEVDTSGRYYYEGPSAIIRLTPAGAPDTTWSGDGISDNPGAGLTSPSMFPYGHGWQVMPDGGVAVPGYATFGDVDTVLAMLGPNGALDPDFGTNGRISYPRVGTQRGKGVALGVDGDLVIVSDTPGAVGVDGFIVNQVAGRPLVDYQKDTNDWDLGSSMFGACLRALSGTNVAPAWTIDPDATCTADDNDPWKPIPTTSSVAAAKIAGGSTPGTTDIVARLRFGTRITAAQTRGIYVAPLTFVVVAPNA
jgi:uncharacterized delta-60 repeat protein